MESLCKALKRELPLDRKYESRIEARQEVFKSMELHCDTKRSHSSLLRFFHSQILIFWEWKFGFSHNFKLRDR